MGSIEQSINRELADAGREFYRRGWVLGTSGNFSAITSRDPMRFSITASGLEKGALEDGSFIEVDEAGSMMRGDGRPSAETSLHSVIYRLRPEAASVLHTHSVWGTIPTPSSDGVRAPRPSTGR